MHSSSALWVIARLNSTIEAVGLQVDRTLVGFIDSAGAEACQRYC
jgi:hypothetical protein